MREGRREGGRARSRVLPPSFSPLVTKALPTIKSLPVYDRPLASMLMITPSFPRRLDPHLRQSFLPPSLRHVPHAGVRPEGSRPGRQRGRDVFLSNQLRSLIQRIWLFIQDGKEVLKLLNYGLNLRHFREQKDQERLTGEERAGREGVRG